MKKLIIVIALALLANYSNSQTVKIENLPGNVVITKGGFQFPSDDTLKKYEVKLSYDSITNSYTLSGAHSELNNVTIVGGNITVNNHIQSDTVIKSYISVINGNVIVNGKVISSGDTYTPTFYISLPENINLRIESIGNISVKPAVNSLYLESTGSNTATFGTVKHIKKLDLTGSGTITIDSCHTAGDLELTGSGTITIQKCFLIESIDLTGSGTITIPVTAKVEDQDVTGSGKIVKR